MMTDAQWKRCTALEDADVKLLVAEVIALRADRPEVIYVHNAELRAQVVADAAAIVSQPDDRAEDYRVFSELATKVGAERDAYKTRNAVLRVGLAAHLMSAVVDEDSLDADGMPKRAGPWTCSDCDAEVDDDLGLGAKHIVPCALATDDGVELVDLAAQLLLAQNEAAGWKARAIEAEQPGSAGVSLVAIELLDAAGNVVETLRPDVHCPACASGPTSVKRCICECHAPMGRPDLRKG